MNERGAQPRLARDLHGAASAPALALVHGILSSNLQWEPNRAALGERLRLVEVELWGHGQSPTPREAAAYTAARYVAALDAIRAEQAIARWLVCGQSFGAGIAIRYALAHPERTLGLIVTNSRSAFSDVAAEAGERDLASWQQIDRQALPFHPVHASRFPAELKARMVAAADAVPAFALLAGDDDHREGPVVPGRCGAAPRSDVAGQRPLREALPARPRLRRGDDPRGRIADLDGGHAVNVEAAAGFDAAVLAFTEQIVAGAR